MWAALRHRRGQALVLVLVAALVATCAAFAPVFARSVDQAVLRTHVVQAPPEELATTITYGRVAADEDDTVPEDIAAAVPEGLRAISQDPVGGMTVATSIPPASGKKDSPVVVRSRDEVCEHVRITDGSCPDEAGEVLVSAADVEAWGWRRGTTFSIGQERASRFVPQPPDVELTVVGTYQVPDDPEYWLGSRPDGKSGVPQQDLDNVPGVDDMLTDEATFDGAFPAAGVQLALPIDPGAVTLDSLPRAAAAADALVEDDPSLSVSRTTDTLSGEVSRARAQTAVVVPFVALQLALLAVVVLFLVAQAAVEQRRHDVALARLRGRSRAGARRLLLTELAVPVVLGVPVGLLLAMGLAVAVRLVLLPRGLPFEVPLVVLGWLAGALVVSLAAVAVAAGPVLREPVSALLREVPATSASGPRLVEWVVVVLAVLGVVGLATGLLSGPAALAAPTLLAIAVGLVAARLLPVVATRGAGRALRRGRIAGVVAAHGIARRAAARRALVVTTVGTAVVVFGANAVVVAGGNREARAELETGAPAVVEVTAGTTTQLTEAAAHLREAGIEASPVVTIRPTDAGADATIAVDPATLERVAHPGTTQGLDLTAFALPDQDPIDLTGRRITGVVIWETSVDRGIDEPPVLKVDITTATGDRLSRDLVTLGPGRSGRARIDADVLCPDRCRLDGLRVAASGETGSELATDLTVSDLALDGEALPVGGADTWTGPEGEDDPGLRVVPKGDVLDLSARSTDGADVAAVVADVPRPLPGIVSGSGGGGEREILTIAGGQVGMRPDQEVTALPAVTDTGVMVSLPALGRLSRTIDTERAHPQLWLDDAAPATLDRVRELVADDDLGIRSVTTTAEAKRAFDRSASAWGLQLALLAGGLAVLLAGLVLLVLTATGWRATVADLAALRISGVRQPDLARAVRTEHLVTVGVGVLLGTVSAVVGAAVAMPSVPLFTEPAAVPVPDLSTAWWAVATAAAVTAVLLLALALLLARWVAARVHLSAARGESA